MSADQMTRGLEMIASAAEKVDLILGRGTPSNSYSDGTTLIRIPTVSGL